MKVNVLIDSFGWIEYFGDGPLANKYGSYIENTIKDRYLTPTIVLYEVYKKIKKERTEEKALWASAYISANTEIIHLNERIALEAAEISLVQGLHMADAIIVATADVFKAKIVTSDPHFEGLKNVELIK